MTAPCQQEHTISDITKALDRMEGNQDRLIEMVEKVANQAARLDALEIRVIQQLKDTEGLFVRVSALELLTATAGPETKLAIQESLILLTEKVDKLMIFVSLLSSPPIKWLIGVIIAFIVVGTYCDIMYHLDTIKAVLSVWKG